MVKFRVTMWGYVFFLFRVRKRTKPPFGNQLKKERSTAVGGLEGKKYVRLHNFVLRVGLIKITEFDSAAAVGNALLVRLGSEVEYYYAGLRLLLVHVYCDCRAK